MNSNLLTLIKQKSLCFKQYRKGIFSQEENKTTKKKTSIVKIVKLKKIILALFEKKNIKNYMPMTWQMIKSAIYNPCTKKIS